VKLAAEDGMNGSCSHFSKDLFLLVLIVAPVESNQLFYPWLVGVYLDDKLSQIVEEIVSIRELLQLTGQICQ
jgi:hypothetical protein